MINFRANPLQPFPGRGEYAGPSPDAGSPSDLFIDPVLGTVFDMGQSRAREPQEQEKPAHPQY